MRIKASVLFSVFLSVGLIIGFFIRSNTDIPVFSDAHTPVILIDAGHRTSVLCFKSSLNYA